jgi:hypothetical protein
MNEEKQADALVGWVARVLDPSAPPPDPPDGLDDDVAEAIYALRPDRAPAPRWTAADLVDAVTSGPLAGTGSGGSAAYGASAPDALPVPANRPGPRRWATFGAIGAFAAACLATALLTGGPGQPDLLPSPAAPIASPSGAAAESVATPASEPLAPAASAPLADAAQLETSAPAAQAAGGGSAPSPAPVVATRAPVSPEAPAPVAADAFEGDAVADAEVDDAGGFVGGGLVGGTPSGLGGLGSGAAANRSAPSEAEAKEEARAVAREAKDEASPKSAAKQELAERPAAPKRDTRAAPAAEAPAPPPMSAAPATPSSPGWAEGLSASALQPYLRAQSDAVRSAAQGRLDLAALAVAAMVGPPARAGQHHAALAAGYWLAAGEPTRAESIARQGLALSAVATPERDACALRLREALAAQATVGTPANDAGR